MRPVDARQTRHPGRHGKQRSPPHREDEEHGDERVGGRQRAEKRRHEPPKRIRLVAGVVHPVLGKTGEPPVVEPELLAVPARHAGVAPPLQRHEVDVEQPPERDHGCHRRRGGEHQPLLT
jgi:hypothetical protein